MTDQISTRPKFCENCGSPLDPHVAFCENCGARIPEQAAMSQEVSSSLEERDSEQQSTVKTELLDKNELSSSMPGSVISADDKVKEVSTSSNPALNEESFVLDDAPSPAQEPFSHVQPPINTQTAQKGSSSGKVSLIIGVGVLVLVLGGFLALAIIKPPISFLAGTPFSSAKTAQQLEIEELKKQIDESEKKEQQVQKDQQDEEESQNDTAKTIHPNEITSLMKEQVALNSVWLELGDINRELVKRVNDFNKNWKNGSVPSFDDLNNKVSELQKQMASITEMYEDPYGNSDYYYSATVQKLNELIDDLQNRIDVLQTASNMVNRGDSRSEILKVLGKDNLSNGVNKYKAHFDKNYQTAEPPSPPEE